MIWSTIDRQMYRFSDSGIFVPFRGMLYSSCKRIIKVVYEKVISLYIVSVCPLNEDVSLQVEKI